MAEKTNTPSIAVVDGEILQKQIERFDAAIQRMDQLPGILSDFFDKMRDMIEEQSNLQTYSILAATRITGIGYKKLNDACKSGQLPFIVDGKTYKIKHVDLYKFIERQKKR